MYGTVQSLLRPRNQNELDSAEAAYVVDKACQSGGQRSVLWHQWVPHRVEKPHWPVGETPVGHGELLGGVDVMARR